jgi:twitching motility protein PilI
VNSLLTANAAVPERAFSEFAYGTTPNSAIQEIQRYGFKIGNWSFLFPENCLGEIVVAPEICPIPHTRSWMRGVMSLRGNLIPIFDLHGLLLDAPIDLHKPMVLILDQGKQALGFMLKEPPQWLTGLIEAAEEALPLPDSIADQISKIYRQQDNYWLAFNKTDFFTFLAENAKSF